MYQSKRVANGLKSRFFKNRELYWYNLSKNSNLGRESLVQKSGVRIPVGEGQIFCHFSFFLYLKWLADAHFASKNTLLKRNTLLLKSLTHLAAQITWQSHNLLLSTPCSLTPFATQNPLLLITPCSSTPFATQNPLLLITPCSSTLFTSQNTLLLRALCFSTPFAPWNTLLLRSLCSLTPFSPWNTLLLRTLRSFNTFCSMEHFNPQHPFLPGTLCSSRHYAPWNSFDHDVK